MLKLTFCNWPLDWKLTDLILIKRGIILPLNHKFTVFFFRQGKENFTIWMSGLCQIPEISFSRQGRNASNNKHLASDSHGSNTELEEKITLHEQHSIETLVNNPLVKRRAEHFTVWMNSLCQIYNFFRQGLRNASFDVNISQAVLSTHGYKTQTFTWRKNN